MNEQEKKQYLEKYKKDKANGVSFFPDIIFKDSVVTLVVFLILVALAYFVGAPVEERANPNDTNYTPRPEWYFLFLFQMLKYFPGNLEVVGAMILPGLFIVLLLLLPFIDKSPLRHPFSRPYASLAAIGVVLGIVGLTWLALNEAPPPSESAVVDQSAALYAKNCANCHGSTIDIPAGMDLHQVIASGTHAGMPAWGGDLSADEIDLLAGFILSPNGSALYTKECAVCHENILASGNPLELQRVFDEGKNYPSHKGLDIPNWKETLNADQQNALLNFLAAPDGQRLFAINCSGCHGEGVAFSGSMEELRNLIVQGGHEVTMPGWKGTLSDAELNTLADYVVDPKSSQAGNTLFGQYCASCHGDKVPLAPDKDSALKMIASGGSHITMPVWGEILTPEQIDALTAYTLESGKTTGSASGAKLFADNCSGCHGNFGEGGPNPTREGDIIAPISSAEYLKTRDDATLRNIIVQGQPDFGMSAFGTSSGGPLSDDQVDAIVAFIRSWQANPPVVLPSEVAPSAPSAPSQASLTPAEVFSSICAKCHGATGEGGVGPALNTEEFQAKYDDQALFDTISKGHEATPMIAWGDVLTSEQIQGLVQYLRGGLTSKYDGTPGSVSFAKDVMPILQTKCQKCHNDEKTFGDWNASSYQMIMTSGKNAPAVIANDADKSALLQRLLGVTGFKIMPPTGGPLSDKEIEIIKNWILAGAPNN